MITLVGVNVSKWIGVERALQVGNSIGRDMTIEMQNHHAAVVTGSQITVTAVRNVDVILPAEITGFLAAEAGAVSLPDVGKQKFNRWIPDPAAFGGTLPAAVSGVKQTVDAVMRTHGPPAAGTLRCGI